MSDTGPSMAELRAECCGTTPALESTRAGSDASPITGADYGEVVRAVLGEYTSYALPAFIALAVLWWAIDVGLAIYRNWARRGNLEDLMPEASARGRAIDREARRR